jgi:hypothetical protein
VTPRAAEKNGIKYSHHEHTKSLNLFIMSNWDFVSFNFRLYTRH